MEFVFNQYKLPSFPVPEGYTDEAYFRMLCMKGFQERYPSQPEAYRQRLEYEIGVISKMGYVNYYLIVWDFIRYAKESGIPVGPGRGSRRGIHCGLLPAPNGSRPYEIRIDF